MMNKTGIRKVMILQGMAKVVAEEYGLDPDDLVIVTVSLEKVIGDPVSYLLSKVQSSDQGENMRELYSSYDEEADVMYVSFYRPPKAAEYSTRVGDFIFRYIGEELIGITITDFRGSASTGKEALI